MSSARMPRGPISVNKHFVPRRYGTELTSKAVLKWAKENAVEWHYIHHGKP